MGLVGSVSAAGDYIVEQPAGAIIIGKTNVPPWTADWQTNNPLFGRSNNPWDLSRTPGGSTGGGAAAVAAGLTPLEFGADLAGSIRIPAAFCGIYGHKPSETAVPRSGLFPGATLPNVATALAVAGPLARSAPDLELARRPNTAPAVSEFHDLFAPIRVCGSHWMAGVRDRTLLAVPVTPRDVPVVLLAKVPAYRRPPHWVAK